MLLILFYHAFSSFSVIDIYFLIPAVIAQMFNPTAEFTIPIKIPTKKAKNYIETYPVTAETKIDKCLI